MHPFHANASQGTLRPFVWLWLLAALLAPSLAPSAVQAQERGPRLHLGAGVALDFGGEVELDRGYNYNRGYDSLRATPGLRGHLDYAVHKHVSVGGMVRLSWWEPDWTPSIGRSFLLDLAPRVIGRFDWRQFRFYGGLAPGLTLSAVRDYGINVSNPAAGFTLSLTIAGMEWWFSPKAALFVEMGWVGHWFSHDNEQGPGDLRFRLSQGLFELGFVFGV